MKIKFSQERKPGIEEAVEKYQGTQDWETPMQDWEDIRRETMGVHSKWPFMSVGIFWVSGSRKILNLRGN